MKTLRLFVASILFCGVAAGATPSSINNDDSCDIKVGPAATLLLPYFEVDVAGTSGRTTLFTVTNVTRYPQIAHVTLWTDWAYPVFSFNLFLTGYDIQAINLADVLIRGTIAPPGGTSQATTPGALSVSTNPNLRPSLDCANNPGSVPATIMSAVRAAFTVGVFRPPGAAACSTMGGVHINAVGYATIDVVANCTGRMPLDPLYYTTDLLFDNVLIGDYQQIGARPAGTGLTSAFDAAGNPMVHIRAVPEGGGAGSDVPTALPYTFYDRYTPSANRTVDRRQPLPSTFAARYIQGGTSAFWTNVTVWREALDRAGASCASYLNNSDMPIGESVRFDEHENPSGFRNDAICAPCAGPPPTASAASSTNTIGSTYPPLYGTDVGGWLYLNLNNGGSSKYSVTQDVGGVRLPTNTRTSLTPIGSTPTIGPRPSQNWVTVTMFGNAGTSRMTAEFEAAPLGNGCSPAAFQFANNWFFGGSLLTPIGPAGGAFVCPPGTTLTNGTTTLCTGTNANPNP